MNNIDQRNGLLVLLGAVTLCTIVLVACTSRAQSKNSKPAHIEPNPTLDLAVEFHGERMGPDDEPNAKLLVERIAIRTSDGESVIFMPTDFESLQSSFGFYTQVWSPDGAYMILPLGKMGTEELLLIPSVPIFSRIAIQLPVSVSVFQYQCFA